MINRLPRKLKKHLKRERGLYRKDLTWHFAGPYVIFTTTHDELLKQLDEILWDMN